MDNRPPGSSEYQMLPDPLSVDESRRDLIPGAGEPMTDERLSEIEAAHYSTACDLPACWECAGDWPCETAQLVAEVRRLRDRVEDLEDEGRILWGNRFGKVAPARHLRRAGHRR